MNWIGSDYKQAFLASSGGKTSNSLHRVYALKVDLNSKDSSSYFSQILLIKVLLQIRAAS
jgi:hypothetical protein